ncbi:TetR/AcrR family transcriptional regulator [Gluconacetobacter takamatsuzukensis]|uniref:TetR/AcrR family transcriptional regulator n=1 Tax=Gluconacetobacter takamatsuzukensis TaxID=1286190 RepID=A0A7W4KEK7_9PROT|nr:TetR/AcrR family transcriptional regulator [Gluconacetobacter takamatsuzukensis]MBB2205513.1 TetR/AcrR family transcriptional regulator [Gluconacetobacter takamatsuzukensis]
MSSSPSPARRPSAAERIRQSARDLFYRQGIRAVGVEEIVQTAGVTKPSLYRAFRSKDGLAAAFLADYQCSFWERVAAARAAHPDDARAQVLAYFDALAARSAAADYRGCALTNAILDYPDRAHPVRQEAARLKHEVRDWLVERARQMGAADADALADGLVLLMEGAFVVGQAYPPPGPAARVGECARLLVDAQCGRR